MIFFTFLLLSSCSEEKLTLSQVLNNHVEFDKQEVSIDSDRLSLMIPVDWIWRNEQEDCDGKNVFVMINAISPEDKDGYYDLISIQKIKSQNNSTDLKSEFNYLLEKSRNQPYRIRIIESGKTNALNYPAYYFHTKSESGTYGETETIGFIVKSDVDGIFYHLIASASQTDNLKENMSEMIQALKSFKINNNN